MIQDDSYFKQKYEDMFDNEKRDNYVLNKKGVCFSLGDLKILYKNRVIPTKIIAKVLGISNPRLIYLLKLYQLYSTQNQHSQILYKGSIIYLRNYKKLTYKRLMELSEILSIESASKRFGIPAARLTLLLKCLDLISEKPINETKITESEYVQVSYLAEDGTKKWRSYHRKVMEDFIGRDPEKSELIHHIDGDKQNNSIENLYITKGVTDHAKIHHNLDDITYKLIRLGVVKFENGNYIINNSISWH